MTKYPRLPRSVCGSKQSIHWRWVPPLFHNYFSPSSEQPNNVYQLISGTANCRLYSNISQTLPLYKVWGYYYNKFDSMKSFGVYHWYVKMPPCGCVEHGLEYITFYVKKYIEHLVACLGPPAGSRQTARILVFVFNPGGQNRHKYLTLRPE